MRYAGLLWMAVVASAGVMAQRGAAADTGATRSRPRTQQGAPAPAASDYLGAWSGSWDGPTSGEFDLTLDRGRNGAPHGKLTVTAGSTPYTAEFKTLSIDGATMSGTYDYPLDEGGEVTIEATFDGRTAKGTWILRPQGQPQEETARGTLVLSRK